jgi:hypothetical protein
MADQTSEDLSPSEFVKNIHALGKRKDAEDAKRIAELESQILVDRELRAQRRAGELWFAIYTNIVIIGLRRADCFQNVHVLSRLRKALLPARLLLSTNRPRISLPPHPRLSTRRKWQMRYRYHLQRALCLALEHFHGSSVQSQAVDADRSL